MAEHSDRLTTPQGDPREALQEVIRAIKRNAVRVAFTTLVFLMLGYGLTMLWPSKYESVTQFVLRDWHIVDTALIEELSEISYQKKLLTLQNELRSRKRIESVMSELQWAEWLDTAGKESERRKLIQKFGDNLLVDMEADVTGASNITIKFKWTNPRKAMDFTNRLRDSWIQLVLEGDKKRKEDEADRQEAIVVAREADYNTALAALRAYELENQTPGLGDPATNNTLKANYLQEKVLADAELEALVGEIGRIEDALALIPKEVEAPVKPASPEQAAAMQRLAGASALLTQMSDPQRGYTAQHPKRIAAQRDYDEAKEALAKLGAGAVPAVEMVTNDLYFLKATELEDKKAKEREVRAKVNQLQTQLDATQKNLDTLPVVAQELDRLKSDIDTARQLSTEAKLAAAPLRERVKRIRAASQFGTSTTASSALQGGGPIEILETAVEAEDPVLPIGAIIMAVSLVVGLAVGALGPVLAEMTRSSFGTVKEVSRSLGVPVLGAVDMILTARDVRARTIQQTLTWSTMALVLLALGTALYLYHSHPEDLPAALMRALRDVRMALT